MGERVAFLRSEVERALLDEYVDILERSGGWTKKYHPNETYGCYLDGARTALEHMASRLGWSPTDLATNAINLAAIRAGETGGMADVGREPG